MDYKKLADLLFPDVKVTADDYLKQAKRNLPQNADVTRTAPSPTGYLHIGTVYGAFIDKLIAKKSNGIFYMRLEDTDSKREVKNVGTIAYDMLCYFGLKPDEGYTGDDREQVGNYGSYIQSQRKDIYKAFAKKLVELGRGFPCFCEKAEGKEDILKRREQQLSEDADISAKDPCRDLTLEQVEEKLKQGKPFAIRLLSKGNAENIIKFTDLIKGDREIRENEKDAVVLKSDGIPPYSLAHIVDDTLMQTTVVVRGEEWYPSLNVHLELFDAFGIKPPKYAHTPVICKIDEDGNKRKLSKRKDREADARYFVEQGYPVESVMEYLLNLINSDFEDWRKQNPTLPYMDFPFDVSKIGSNNPMFDFVKLDDVSKNVISKFPAERIYEDALVWAKEFNPEFYNLIVDKKDFCLKIFSIDRLGEKPRKDIAKWSDLPELFDYMFVDFDTLTLNQFAFDDKVEKQDIVAILNAYVKDYNDGDEKQVWFDKIKSICEPLGFTSDMKAYRKNPENFKGSVATVSGVIRVAITKKQMSPDLYEICKLLGNKTVSNRIKKVISLLG